MSSRIGWITLTASLFLLGPASRGADEKTPPASKDPAAELLAKAVPDTSTLPTADMAIVPSLQVLEDAIVITVKDEGYALAYLKPQKLSMKELLESKEVASAKDADELAKDVANLLDRPLWDRSKSRGPDGLSRRNALIAVAPHAGSHRMFQVFTTLAKCGASEVWILAKDASGHVGALTVSLPRDGGETRATKRESFEVWIGSIQGDSPRTRIDELYGAAYSVRKFHGAAQVDCLIRFMSRNSEFEQSLAVVNECRRFGFRAEFAIEVPGDPFDAEPANEPCYTFSPAVEIPADLPAKVPGRAVFGDPSKND